MRWPEQSRVRRIQQRLESSLKFVCGLGSSRVHVARSFELRAGQTDFDSRRAQAIRRGAVGQHPLMAAKRLPRRAAFWHRDQVSFGVGIAVRLFPGALPRPTRRRGSAWGEQPSIPDHWLRYADNDGPEIGMPRVDEDVAFPARHGRGHHQYRRSQRANAGVAKCSRHAQVRMIPTSGQPALVVSLDGNRPCNRDLDRDIGARHTSDAGTGQTHQHRARTGTAGVADSQAQ